MPFFKTFMLVLLGIAAAGIPLGLYEGMVPEPSSEAEVFHYIRDTNPMGYGTSSRTNSTWSRICGSLMTIPCPNDNNKATVFRSCTVMSVYYEQNRYDTHVPQKAVDVF
jgi:hypothetical protein